MNSSNGNTGSTAVSSGTTSTSINKSYSVFVRDYTLHILQTRLSRADLSNYELVESMILEELQYQIEQVNPARPKGSKWKIMTTLLPSQIADIICYTYSVVRIMSCGEYSDEAYDMLGIYQEDGPNKGIYVTSEDEFRRLARCYNYNIKIKECDEVLFQLKMQAKRVMLTREPNLIAVNNGIFDYDTKQLLPFDPSYVFTSKSKVNYNPNATNVVIHNAEDGSDWDVESWMNDLSDDPEIVNTLWEILGAIIRPNVKWDKSAWLYSETGNNGKGTLCELMRQLCGDGSYASIPLSEMGKEFVLEPLTHATSIIVDENDVGTYIDKAANLKAIITGDVIQINRKFKMPIAFRFCGFMVQCLNEMPRIKDKSDSFYRRQLFIPFDKCFTGKERKYIKHDYLKRPEVLEYVLYKVLNMNYYTLSEPAACLRALNDYKMYVDPIRQYLDEFIDNFVWDFVPNSFLYDLYKEWHKLTAGNERSMKGKNTFLKEVKTILKKDYDDWDVADSPIRATTLINKEEPLIGDYDLVNWKNPQYKDRSTSQACTPTVQCTKTYRGIYRIKAAQTVLNNP